MYYIYIYIYMNIYIIYIYIYIICIYIHIYHINCVTRLQQSAQLVERFITNE